MKKIVKFAFFIYLFFVFNVFSVFALIQNPASADSLYKKALYSFLQEDYKSSIDLFKKAIISSPNLYLRNSVLLLGLASSLDSDFGDANLFLEKSLNDFPESDLLLTARYFTAKNHFSLKNYDKCLIDLAYLLTKTGFIENHKEIVDNYINIDGSVLSIKKLKNLSDQTDNADPVKKYLALKLAHSFLLDGNEKSSEAYLNYIDKTTLVGKTKDYYSALKNQAEKILDSPLFLGVISPFSSHMDSDGLKFLEGAKFAVNKYNLTAGRKVRLLPVDPEGDKIKAVKSVRDMAGYINLVGLIGPMNQDLIVGTMIESDYGGVPVIPPFSNLTALTSIGENIFQINAANETHAKEIAQYAVNTLNLKTFAVMAPVDKEGQELADNFSEEIDRLGGKILAQQWYIPGVTDYSSQFKKIREIGLNTMKTDSLFLFADSVKLYNMGWDTLTALKQDSIKKLFTDTLSLQEIDSMKLVFMEIRMQELRELGKTYIDTFNIPVTVFDAIFIPAKTEEIKYLAPQIAFHNFETQLLGAKGWHDVDELSKNNSYLNNIIFTSDYYFNEINYNFREFRNEFFLENDRAPGKFEVYGYDSANLFLEAIKNGGSDRKSIRKYLENLSDHSGIKGTVSFKGTKRTNNNVRILKYTSGTLENIK